MKRQKVESTNLASIGYEDGVLEIQFQKGLVYQYFDVPDSVHEELMESESIGKSFFRLIKAGGFKYECLGRQDV